MAAAPSFELTLDGQVLTGKTLRHVLSMELSESTDALDALSLQLAVPANAAEVLQHARVGVPFSVDLSQDGALVRQVDGDIVEVGHTRSSSSPWVVSLRGLDRMHRLKVTGELRRNSGTHSAVVTEIARRNGFVPEVQRVNARFDENMQLGTDAETLARLARQHNYIVRIEGDVLHFKRREDTRSAAPVVLHWGTDIDEVQITWKIDGLPTEMEVFGHDHERHENLRGKATARDLKRISGGPLGVELVQGAFGSRKVTRGNISSSTGSGSEQTALSELQSQAEQFLTGSVSGPGRPLARSGGLVELRGIGPLSGRYLITETRHSFGGGAGYRTSISFSSDSLPPGAA